MSHRDELIQAFIAHYDALRARVERRVRSPELAADIVQDCYLRIVEHDPAVPIENPLAFLHRVIGNLTIDRLREREVRARRDGTEEMQQEMPDDAPCNETVLLARQRLSLLMQAVDELPPRCREVFILRKLRHLEYDDIASRMGISRNMVEKHLRKALLHCQARLAEYD